MPSLSDVLEFSDDSSPGGSEGQKGCPGKQGDKSKDLGRKIFSGPKKVGKVKEVMFIPDLRDALGQLNFVSFCELNVIRPLRFSQNVPKAVNC